MASDAEALDTIQPGSEVVMHFSITLKDGTVADSTEGEEPLQFVMGDQTLIEGLELALYGLKVGDKQSLTIDPENAYGFPDPENIHVMQRDEFPEDMEIKKGVIIAFAMPDEDEYPGTITAVDEKQVTVDFNHPIAGHEIVFDVEILEIVNGGEQPVVQ